MIQPIVAVCCKNRDLMRRLARAVWEAHIAPNRKRAGWLTLGGALALDQYRHEHPEELTQASSLRIE